MVDGAEDESRDVPHAGRRRVLVVEDDDSIRECLLELLTDNDYDAVGAIHGRDALNKLESLDPPPSVIVLDLMMPVMDGKTFRDKQLRNPEISQIPVIVVSACHDVAYRVRELHAAAYLKKPLIVNDLLKLVRQHVLATSN
jgi:two-component system response regulator CpxR